MAQGQSAEDPPCPECGEAVQLHHRCPQQARCKACGAELVLRGGGFSRQPTLYTKAAVEARWRSKPRGTRSVPSWFRPVWTLVLLPYGEWGRLHRDTVAPRSERANVTLAVVAAGEPRYEPTTYGKTVTRSVVINWGHTCCACFEKPATHYGDVGTLAPFTDYLRTRGQERTTSFKGVPYCERCYRKAYKGPGWFRTLLLLPLLSILYSLLLRELAKGVKLTDYDWRCHHWVSFVFENRDYAEWFVAANSERLIWAE